MPEHDDALASFCEALNGASKPSELTHVLTTTMERLGFRHACYHVVRLEGGTVRLPYVLHNYGDAWADHYFKEGYLDIDPILKASPGQTLPFHWSSRLDPEALNRDQRRMFDEAHDAGIHDGYSIPILGPHQDLAAVTVIPDATGPEGHALIEAQKHLIHVMAIYFDRHARSPLVNAKLSSPRQKTLLSPREHEVLRWTAHGKTSSETADILGVSAKSVEFHLENAKRKLGTYSKTHAVVKALTLGLVRM
ncbi:helix-turn-helix transcriptional regulator [Pararhodospirillum photometricum]|nr:LuxR family transcriptional regulator [Pararhodospirillum photometricum]